VRRSAVPVVAIVAAAALVGLLVYGVASRQQDRTLDSAVAHGKRPAAPARSLPVLGAPGDRSLAQLRGKPVLVNFWASWCEPCKAEAPLLEQAQHRLGRVGGTVLGVTYEDTTSDSLRFVRRFGLSYPNVRDIGGKLARAYGTTGLPETFLVDREGRVAALARGQIGQKFLDSALPKVGA
jgi:cytochrome c biogenesis protein CcmG/thiol:disulfide interchange protein DsbE